MSQWSTICSDHFISGKPADLYDVNNPDWVPTLLMSSTERENPHCKNEDSARKRARYVRAHDRVGKKKRFEAAEQLLLLQNERLVSDATVNESEATEHDNTSEVEDEMKCYKLMVADYQRLLVENVNLRRRIDQLELNENFFRDKDYNVKYYTGLPAFITLMTIFNCVCKYIPHNSVSKISKFQKFVCVLIRLRLNSQVQDVANRFGISVSSMSSNFRSVLHVLYVRLKRFIKWPDREELRKTMPLSFRENFGLKVVCIVDCFEIFIERPSNLLARQKTWSNYKHMNTVKYLIGICPQGVVTFISFGWGGRTSDKYLTEHSTFLQNLLPADIVLADRGFDISESVGLMCAELKIPAFTRGQNQLSAVEVERTRKIAHSRVHVERVIGLVRNKFSILRSKLPIDFLINDADGIPPIDKMVTVCCALCNAGPSVVPFD